ncbi:MAG: 30S ribosome-binding factor RbfA [Desulfococcaceae bacterium]
MKSYTRADRVGALIRDILADILRKHIKDPRLEMATVTGVKMSNDLKVAKIYFSISGGKDRVDGAKKGFESAAGFIKRSLAGQLELRYMPELRFSYDESIDYGAHINKLLKSVSTQNGKDHQSPETE